MPEAVGETVSRRALCSGCSLSLGWCPGGAALRVVVVGISRDHCRQLQLPFDSGGVAPRGARSWHRYSVDRKNNSVTIHDNVH